MSDTGRLPRFFIDTPLAKGAVTLSGIEAHHLMHVLRLGSGSRVILFDGSGFESEATVNSMNRHQTMLEAGEPALVNRERTNSVTVAVSLPKADRQKFLVEKLTELGVARLIPLITRRGVAQPTDTAIGRLRKGVIAASKQCGRNRLMEIGGAIDLNGLLKTGSANGNRFYAHPGPGGVQLAVSRENPVTVIAIGPEGGFEDAEVIRFEEQAWVRTCLGCTVLRVETAAIAAATLLCIGPPD